VTAIGRDKADFTEPQKIIEIVKSTDADIIINAVAYTSVDLAEEEFELANIINGTTVKELAKVSASRNIPFLHISTDYVFKGGGNLNWKTSDQTNPQNSYGKSKLIGESGILEAGGPHVILRTSWVFSSHVNNFVKTMLRLASNNNELSIVKDQIGGPTCAKDIANALWKIASDFYAGNGITGIYHFSGKPNSSWANFASVDLTISIIFWGSVKSALSRPIAVTLGLLHSSLATWPVFPNKSIFILFFQAERQRHHGFEGLSTNLYFLNTTVLFFAAPHLELQKVSNLIHF
jgi:dTDP-4-dehydrorhamnose reductase